MGDPIRAAMANALLWRGESVVSASLSGTQNDFLPGGNQANWDRCTVVDFAAVSSGVLTGLDAANRMSVEFCPFKILLNSDSASITLNHSDSASIAVNKFWVKVPTAAHVVPALGNAILFYDYTYSFWRVLA